MICCDSVQERRLALGFSNSCTCTYHPLLAGAAATAMDYMPPQFPNLPIESSDIFSLSDQVLSDRLEFIEEVGSIQEYNLTFLLLPDRLALETGVASGYAGPNLLFQKMALCADRLARRLLLNSFTGLKPQLLQLAYDHCGLRLLDVFAF